MNVNGNKMDGYMPYEPLNERLRFVIDKLEQEVKDNAGATTELENALKTLTQVEADLEKVNKALFTDSTATKPTAYDPHYGYVGVTEFANKVGNDISRYMASTDTERTQLNTAINQVTVSPEQAEKATKEAHDVGNRLIAIEAKLELPVYPPYPVYKKGV